MRTTHILHAELDKLLTLPAIKLTFWGTLLVNLVLTAAFTAAGLQESTGTQHILETGLASIGYIQAGFIILGVLATCSEYTGGQIRTTLTVTPWRGLQLSTKHVALALLTIPMALIISASGVLYSFIMMQDTAAAMETGTVIQTVLGAIGYLTLTTLLSAAIGALLKRTTPALVILLGYYFIAGPFAKGLLTSGQAYFPDTAGSSMYTPPSPVVMDGALSPLQGAGVLLLWTLLFIGVAIVFYRRRDA